MGKTQGNFIDDRIANMMRGTRKNYKQSIRACKDSADPTLPSFEEKVMLMFFDLVGNKDTLEVSQEAEKDPKKQEMVAKLRQLGFHTKDFLNLIADQHVNQSSNKKANE